MGVVRACHAGTAAVYASALAVMLFCLEIFGLLDAAIPFIYFQL